MRNLFNSVKVKAPGTSAFDLTHDVKGTCNFGELVPIMVMDIVPGDKVRIGAESLLRFMPLVSPAMHRFDITMHYWFVPNRIVWPGWEKFIIGEPDGDNPPAFPFLQFETLENQRLANYLGLPITNLASGGDINVSAIPFAAYQMIYNEFYRDQNLIDPVPFELVNGNNNTNIAALTALRKRAWEHDYFTSCLPFAQAGQQVDIPLGDVTLDPDWTNGTWTGSNPNFKNQQGVSPDGDLRQVGNKVNLDSQGNDVPNAYDPAGTLEVEATTINDLRRAFRLQEWLERLARGGKRYAEVIRNFFNVKPQDSRLQRPEYICGIKNPIIISEVLNTTGTAELPQGNMAGHALGVTSFGGDGYYATEHGYVIGIMSVMPKTSYMDGVPKHFLKITDHTDFYWPQFANIGEQAVVNREIYANSPTPDATFGYLPRYAEYKFIPNRVCGQMATTLDFWHAARKFASTPTLSEQFISCDADTANRIFAVEDPEADKLVFEVLNKVMAIRPMPKYGTPTF